MSLANNCSPINSIIINIVYWLTKEVGCPDLIVRSQESWPKSIYHLDSIARRRQLNLWHVHQCIALNRKCHSLLTESITPCQTFKTLFGNFKMHIKRTIYICQLGRRGHTKVLVHVHPFNEKGRRPKLIFNLWPAFITATSHTGF